MHFRGTVGRHFLFLQGPGGKFFYQLARLLETDKSRVTRVNVCAGDYFMWRDGESAVNYRGGYRGWEAFLRHYVAVNSVTDIVVFSDSRPYHRVAKAVAADLDINLFVFENGYLRPDWITLELGGVNGNSCFPRSRAELESLPVRTETRDPELPRPSRLKTYWPDVKFHFANTLFAFLFPCYKRHRSALPFFELAGHCWKWLRWPLIKQTSANVLKRLWRERRPYYLFALQLEHDYQLIEHSPFSSMHEACERVIESFAHNAPEDSVLLVKNHPLDNHLKSRRRQVAELAERYGVADRVEYIETGPNPSILRRAIGMVSVNSTMGTSALFHNVPTCAMGRAVYDIDGLTHQLGLDAFWSNPTPPDQALYRHFRQALIRNCQIRGRFVTAEGRAMAARAAAERILATPYVASVQTRIKVSGSTDIELSHSDELKGETGGLR